MLKGAVQELPGAVGMGLANWNWRVVHQFVADRFGISLNRSSCLNYPRLHEGRLCTDWICLQASQEAAAQGERSQTEAFAAEYAALWEEAQRTEARIFFADEAHFRANAELRGKWVLKGEPAPSRRSWVTGGAGATPSVSCFPSARRKMPGSR